MSRKNQSPLWKYFKKISGQKALCNLCNEHYAYGSTTGNLHSHLKKKHPVAFIKVMEIREQMQKESFHSEQKVIYLIAEDQKLSDTDTPETATTTETDALLDTRDFRPSVFKRKRQENHDDIGADKKRLIEQLTEEKIAVASVQKELMEKQLEETTIKVLILQEEMEHRKHLYDLEKQEMERKKEIQELTKQETLLKIELLKANLSKENTQCTVLTEPDMPMIEIVSTE